MAQFHHRIYLRYKNNLMIIVITVIVCFGRLFPDRSIYSKNPINRLAQWRRPFTGCLRVNMRSNRAAMTRR